MDIGPRERKALTIGQLLAYLRTMGIDEPESVPIHFPDELPAVVAAYDKVHGILILSDLDEAPLPAGSYVLGTLDG